MGWSGNVCYGFGLFYFWYVNVLMLPVTAWLPWLLVNQPLPQPEELDYVFSSTLDVSTWTFPERTGHQGAVGPNQHPTLRVCLQGKVRKNISNTL